MQKKKNLYKGLKNDHIPESFGSVLDLDYLFFLRQMF